jgi:adenylosuccinate lyase
MDPAALTALSPLDGRYAAKLSALREHFSEAALIKYRARVEVAWLQTLARELPDGPRLAPADHAQLERIAAEFSNADAAAVKQIEQRTNHDVKALEYWLAERFAAHAPLQAAVQFVHFACTSEDINNLAYALMLEDARGAIVLPALDALIARLQHLAHELAGAAMLSRTHGQPATPTTMGKELANVVHRLRRQRERCASIALSGKMNGAVGNYNAHLAAYPNVDWQRIARNFVEQLGLSFNPYTIQIEPHDSLAELCDALAHVNTVLIDLDRDIWGYVSLGYFKQKLVAGEVGSSTMPHKVNPIDFENSEGNLGLANALLKHFSAKLPISRWQRDLSDSTVLRNLGAALGYCVLAYDACLRGLNKLEADRARMSSELEQSWEVLAEAVQTVMRRHGIADAYDQLKALTRGQGITREALHAFIAGLALPEQEKRRLLALTPSSYLGLAAELAKQI